jgi:hypothetical protein
MPAEFQALNAREPRWQRQAVRLARARTPFVLINFNAARDGNFYFAIRSKYHLRAEIDYEAAHADFQPAPEPVAPARPRLKFRITRAAAGSGVKVDFPGGAK